MDQLHQAKQPATVLAGPYGHPFHPIGLLAVTTVVLVVIAAVTA